MLEIVALEAGYASARVLYGVHMTVATGEVVALLGRNGMGKTTLIRAICGLRPPLVTAGTIRFRDRDLGRLKAHEIARAGLGLVPQGRRLFPSLTVDENLRIAARSVTGGWDLARVRQLFTVLGERGGQRAGSLSGGEQQMLAIGRALMMNPALLVMDEPSEGLSPMMVAQVGERVADLRREGLGILLAEQNVDLALSVADRVDVLGDGGVLAWSGSPTTLRADASLVAQLVGL
jgi:branched-chain amino acid transport system ATP-binding protein